jgi:hypothetical protein
MALNDTNYNFEENPADSGTDFHMLPHILSVPLVIFEVY